MIIIAFLAIVAIGVAAYAAYAFMRGSTRHADIRIGKQEFRVDVADTDILRAKGLMGRTNLGEHEGMIFFFDHPSAYGFWMQGMKIPIDIIWINGDRVAGVTEHLSPDNSFIPKVYYPPEPVNRVLEVRAGTVAAKSIQKDEPVVIRLE